MSFVSIESGKLRISAAGWHGQFVIGYADTHYIGVSSGQAVYTEVVDIQGRDLIALKRNVVSIVETRALTDIEPIGVDGAKPTVQAGSVGLENDQRAFSFTIGEKGELVASEAGWFGSIAVEYETPGRQVWSISGLKPGTYTLSAKSGRDTVLMPLTVQEARVPPSGERSVVINIKNYCTDAVVEGAKVYVDGALRGTAGADGLVSVGSLAAGSHQLRVTAAGYIDSDQDDLVNEQFTV